MQGYCVVSCGRCDCCQTFSEALTNHSFSTFLQVRLLSDPPVQSFLAPTATYDAIRTWQAPRNDCKLNGNPLLQRLQLYTCIGATDSTRHKPARCLAGCERRRLDGKPQLSSVLVQCACANGCCLRSFPHTQQCVVQLACLIESSLCVHHPGVGCADLNVQFRGWDHGEAIQAHAVAH